MRKAIWRVGLVALTLFLVTPAAAAAEGRGDRDRPSIVPATSVAGSTGGALLGDWMGQLLALPKAENPLGGTAELCLNLGPGGAVVSPAGGVLDEELTIEMRCKVEKDQPVVIVMPVGECSTAEDPPYFALTEPDQQRCALRALESLDVTSITLKVDREQPVEIRTDRFLAISPQEQVDLPADPVWGRPGPATFAAASWIAEIRGMGPGQHTMVGTTTAISQGAPITLRFVVHFIVGRR